MSDESEERLAPTPGGSSEVSRQGALRRTCLHQEHLDLEARMVPFAGWDMPVQYAGIIEEHHSVRRAAGMFDVSHMGRVELIGRRAATFLRYLCTYDITRLSPGQGHYSAVC